MTVATKVAGITDTAIIATMAQNVFISDYCKEVPAVAGYIGIRIAEVDGVSTVLVDGRYYEVPSRWISVIDF